MIDRSCILFVLTMLVCLAGCQTQRGKHNKAAIVTTDNAIAFSRLTDNYWQIWTMRPDGSKAKQITNSPSDKRYPIWVNDGKKIFFRTSNNEVFTANVETGEESCVLGSLGQNGGLAVSPDGENLLIVRLRSQVKDSGNLWLTSPDGSDSRILIGGAALHFDPGWSPSGDKITFTQSFGPRTAEVCIADSDGGDKKRLTDDKAIEATPAFSPDGKTVAYSSNTTGDYEIWLVNADGDNQRQLTFSQGIDTRPCWSGDGSKIIFVSNRSGTLQLWIMDSNGANQRQLTTGSPSMDPVWRRN